MGGQLKFGLIGHNIGYSKSSDIFRAIFEIKKIDGSFENFDLEPAKFENEFQTITNKGMSGLSVTIPYKSRVIAMLNDVAPVARSLDAVNSIAIRDNKLFGHNTDIIGFAHPLKSFAPQLKKKRALILGCGGSAKAAIYGLHADFEISQFAVLGRSSKKLAEFHCSLKKILLHSDITTALLTDFNFDSSVKFAIVVNCTPLGGGNHPDKSPVPDEFKWEMTQIYYDLNYNSDNQIVREAAKNNVIAIDGSQMLVEQAIRSFQIWTGETVSFDQVYECVFGRAKNSYN